MPIWRASTMDSWNPLSGRFWTWKNFFSKTKIEDLTKIKEELTQPLNNDIPENLVDKITCELPKNVVFTPYGHLLDVDTLKKHWHKQILARVSYTTCPFTSRPLKEDMLLEGPEFTEIKSKFITINKTRDDLIHKISVMNLSEFDTIQQEIITFQEMLIELDKICKSELEEIQKIDNLKTRLKIDCHATDHLQFWQQQNTSTILGKLGVGSTIKLQDAKKTTFNIPEEVAKMMALANEPHSRYQQFEDSIEKFKENVVASNYFFQPYFKSKAQNMIITTNNVDLRQLKIK